MNHIRNRSFLQSSFHRIVVKFTRGQAVVECKEEPPFIPERLTSKPGKEYEYTHIIMMFNFGAGLTVDGFRIHKQW